MGSSLGKFGSFGDKWAFCRVFGAFYVRFHLSVLKAATGIRTPLNLGFPAPIGLGHCLLAPVGFISLVFKKQLSLITQKRKLIYIFKIK